MWLFGEVRVARGTLAWTWPSRLKAPVVPAAQGQVSAAAQAVEYDEDGRIWAFRYERRAPAEYRIDRDRIFQYMKRHRLPDEGQRAIRRDLRNCADFFTAVRELQTPGEAYSTT